MILIVDMNCKKDSLGYYEFVSPIIEVVKSLDDWAVKHYLEVTSEDLSRCDAIILSGTPLKDTATLSQPEKFQWLKKTGKPVLGICAGMETIGVVYGDGFNALFGNWDDASDGLKENPLFSGDFKAYSLHSICVEPTADFEVWAKSPLCIQVIKHKTKNIYGTLFHPEVRNQEILRNFVRAAEDKKEKEGGLVPDGFRV